MRSTLPSLRLSRKEAPSAITTTQMEKEGELSHHRGFPITFEGACCCAITVESPGDVAITYRTRKKERHELSSRHAARRALEPNNANGHKWVRQFDAEWCVEIKPSLLKFNVHNSGQRNARRTYALVQGALTTAVASASITAVWLLHSSPP